MESRTIDPVNYLKKWIQTIKIAWTSLMAYRLNFFLQIIGPAVVFYFIKYNLWSSIYGNDQGLILKGYNLNQMINYHGWAMVVGLLAQGHNSSNLSEDIRLGRISSYLIYPFNFWEFHTANFLAFILLQLLICSVSLLIFIPFGLLEFPGTLVMLKGLSYCVYVSFFWYSVQYFIGLLGFWLEETWILRVMFMTASGFLSGAIIPLEMFPDYFQAILNYTPFPYLTFYPVKIFLGNSIPLGGAYLVIGVWVIIFVLINKLVWRKGLKLYTAAGM